MKKLSALFLLTIISSCSHYEGRNSLFAKDKEIDLYCQRLNVILTRMSVTASNMANIQTTRVPEGGYYKRKTVKDCQAGICQVVLDDPAPILKYEPRHPDAVKGYVSYPGHSLEEEKYDMQRWSGIYESIVASKPVKNDFFLNDPKAKICFDKYPVVEEKYNYNKYL